MSLLAEQITPRNEEAEQAVLGSVLIDPRCAPTLGISASMFYNIKNRWIWEAIESLRQSETAIDLLTIRGELERKGRLTEIGGATYLTALITAVPTAMHAESYAALVRRAHLRRTRLELASEIARSALNDEDPEARTADFMLALSNSASLRESQPVRRIASKYYDDLAARYSSPGKEIGLKTGSADFDRLTGGLRLKETMILSGEPGKGKSLLAIQWALNVARSGVGVVIYELEMPNERLLDRSVSSASKLPTRLLETGDMTEQQFDAAVQALNEISDLPLYIDDATSWTTADIRADLVRKQNSGGPKIGLVVVDYLRLVADDYGKNEPDREARISAMLRGIFKDLNVSGIVIHSMNKTGMAAAKPGKEHLSGSSQIPYDADQVVFLMDHTPIDGEPWNRNMRTLMWDKTRNSEMPGVIHLLKLPGLPAFGDVARSQMPAPTRKNGKHPEPFYIED